LESSYEQKVSNVYAIVLFFIFTGDKAVTISLVLPTVLDLHTQFVHSQINCSILSTNRSVTTRFSKTAL